MISSNEIIQSLTAENASDWTAIGKTLDALEQLSGVTADGQAWQTIVRDRLHELGQTISTGHINKIRRAYAFLKASIDQLNLPVDRMNNAPISALEVAEKLSHLDPELGLQAAADILSEKNPASYIEISTRYTQYLADHPEKMNPRQAAWRTRKYSKTGKSAQIDDPVALNPLKQDPATPVTGPSDEVSKMMSDLLNRAWQDGKAAGIREAQQNIADRDVQISELLKEVDFYKEEAHELRIQMKITYKKYRECMGDDHEVDWDKYFAEND